MNLFESNPEHLNFRKIPHEMSTSEISWELGLRVESGRSVRTSSNSREHLANDLELHQLELEVQNRQLQESLRVMELSNKKYVDLYDYSPLSYVTLDSNGLISNVNLTTARMFETSKSAMIGKSFILRCSKESRTIFLNLFHACLSSEDGLGTSCELEVTLDGNNFVPFQLHSSRLTSSQDEKSINICLVDLSLKKRADLAESTVNKLHNERTLRENFISTLSHDLITPLTSSKLCAQLLNSKLEDIEQRKRLFEIMLEELARADQMIKELLDANKLIGDKNIPLAFRKCDLGKIAEKCVGTFNEINNLQSTVVVRLNGSLVGFWSKICLVRILDNLISNAVKYGSSEFPITVSVEDRGDAARLIVHNYGDPIQLTEQKKIFQAFHRTEQAVEGGQKGWGLGLNLVKTLVLKHNGKIDVKSNHVEGTSFIIEFPKNFPLS